MSAIKKCFKSRFENGYIVEADFSQLEIICLAQLTQDPNLIADILSGRDMHCVRAAELMKIPESDFVDRYKRGELGYAEKRRLAKAFSFQLQYGSGPTNMAKTNGVAVSLAKEFIENYYNRYPKVKDWQNMVAKEVQASRIWDGTSRTESGVPSGTGQYRSITGKLYTFHEYDNKYKPGQTSFSPTQMKNYPVQGLAADIVAVILGKIYRFLLSKVYYRDHCLLVNTVHDSIIFDVYDKETLDRVVPEIKRIMSNAPKYMKEIFGIDFIMPTMKVDIEIGPNWMEIEKYEV